MSYTTLQSIYSLEVIMKCRVCGAESGKYPLCRVCNIKKEKGEIIKCSICGNWHYTNFPCPNLSNETHTTADNTFLYDAKKLFISNAEQSYYSAIISVLPVGYYVFPQVNLASFIIKNDNSPFHNELFRNVDFLITNEKYTPLFIIEINDQTHLTKERKERDEKVQRICEEAGIPILKFWTSYGVNNDYIQRKINETISSLPIQRIHYFDQNSVSNQTNQPKQTNYQPKYTPIHYRRKSPKGCLGIVASFLIVVACVIAFLL